MKGITIGLPSEAPDQIASVIKLEVSGKPDFEKVLPVQSFDGTLILDPNAAYLHSNSKRQLRVKTVDGKDHIENWLADKSWIYWQFRMIRPGRFTLTSEVATESGTVLTVQLKDGERKEKAAFSDDSHKIYEAEEFVSLDGHEKKEVSIPSTGGEEVFKAVDLGTIEINEPGIYVLEIRPVKDQWNPTRLRGIDLRPCE